MAILKQEFSQQSAQRFHRSKRQAEKKFKTSLQHGTMKQMVRKLKRMSKKLLLLGKDNNQVLACKELILTSKMLI